MNAHLKTNIIISEAKVIHSDKLKCHKDKPGIAHHTDTRPPAMPLLYLMAEVYTRAGNGFVCYCATHMQLGFYKGGKADLTCQQASPSISPPPLASAGPICIAGVTSFSPAAWHPTPNLRY